MIDISPADEAIVNEILKKYVPKCEVRVFGSRHKWTTKPYSDLDIAIVGDAKLDKKTLYALQESFEESELNFRVDVLDWYAISDEFRAIIEQGYTVIQDKEIDNQFPAGWVVKKLGDVVDISSSKRIFAKEYVDNGIPFYRGKEIIEKYHNNDITTEIFISQDRFNEIKDKYGVPKVGDLLLTSVGTLGIPYIVKEGEVFYFKDGNLTWFKNWNGLNNYFLYYWIVSEVGVNAINKISIGSTQQAITIKALSGLEINLPPFEEQKKIAAILSSLDDKIELNQQINKTLEEMAQAIFKEWFIDFNFPDENGNPYRNSGGAMIDSELGQIPASWSVGYFNNLILETVGGDWGKEVSQGNYNQEVLCVRGADINELKIGNKSNAPKRYILEKNLTNKKLNESEIVIEISGGSPTQSTGRTILITNELLNQFTTSLICTNFCRKLKFSSASESLFCYLHLNYLYDNNVFFNYENGTTGVKNLDTSNLFSKHQIILPTKKILELFKENIFSLINGIYSYGKQSQKISNIRDTLLPKLMSGEIRL